MEKLKSLCTMTGFSEKEKNAIGSSRSLKLLLELSAGCIILLILRCIKAQSFNYVFLVWNLFLAWVPAVIARYFIDEAPRGKKMWPSLIAAGAWLMFLPNAPYILTDLFHLHKSQAVPRWFDLILILSFALTGMVLFYLSFLEVERKLGPLLPQKAVRWARMLAFVAVGYGLYLGRYLRFNSWDVLSAPGQLARSMFRSIFSENMAQETLGITFFFAVFLYFGYKLFFLFTDPKILRQDERHIF